MIRFVAIAAALCFANALPALAQTKTPLNTAQFSGICSTELNALAAQQGRQTADTWRSMTQTFIGNLNTLNDEGKVRVLTEGIQRDGRDMAAGRVDKLKVGYRMCRDRAILAVAQRQLAQASRNVPAAPPRSVAASGPSLGDCIQPMATGPNGNGGPRFANRCDFSVSVTMCVVGPPIDQAYAYRDCERQKFGSLFIAERGSTLVSHTRSREVHWTVCRWPQQLRQPVFVPGEGIRGNCAQQ